MKIGTIHHVYAEIKDLLRLSNYKLGEMFDRHGANVRKELKERLKKGEKLIGGGLRRLRPGDRVPGPSIGN